MLKRSLAVLALGAGLLSAHPVTANAQDGDLLTKLRCGAGDDTVKDAEPGEPIADSCEQVKMTSERGGGGTVTTLTTTPQNGRAFSNLTLTATVTEAGTGDPVDGGTVDFILVDAHDLVCNNAPVSGDGVAECPYQFLTTSSLFFAAYSGGSGDEYTIPAGASATSASNDGVAGSDGDDSIRGRAGNDFLRGRGGDDRLRGGADDDHLRGGAGDDLLIGGAGTDELRCGAGDDTVAKVDATDVVADSCESVS